MRYIAGRATISRSPTVHPGDGAISYLSNTLKHIDILPAVQSVRAIGKPPDGVFCAFRHLKNVVVLPSVGL